MAEKTSSLLKSVLEIALSKNEKEKEMAKEKEKEKTKQQLSVYLPIDAISCILLQLPPESLQQLRFVCKPWYRLINNPTFIDDHRRSSNILLIFASPVKPDKYFAHLTKPVSNTRFVESKLSPSQCPFGFLTRPIIDPMRRSFNLKFLEFQNGKAEINDYNVSCLGEIVATCNGLILLANKLIEGGLILMNPVTKDLTTLPVGTLSPSKADSYGFAFCSRTQEYKVVHLFHDNLKYDDCEILNLSTLSWRPVDAPSFGFFSSFGFKPVFAEEALHWVPHVDSNNYIVSMSIDDEKFLKIPLPKTCRAHDRIFELDGVLGLVTYEDANANANANYIDVWILKRLSEQSWEKKYKIFDCANYMIPLYSAKHSGEIIFTDENGRLYAYDTCLKVTTKIQVEKGCFAVNEFYLPHVNSLVSWRRVR